MERTNSPDLGQVLGVREFLPPGYGASPNDMGALAWEVGDDSSAALAFAVSDILESLKKGEPANIFGAGYTLTNAELPPAEDSANYSERIRVGIERTRIFGGHVAALQAMLNLVTGSDLEA